MSAPKHTSRYRDEKVLSRREIEGLIAEGRKIVIVDDKVLKVDAWIPYHPGGDKAILHMVGRDATSEVRAFHSMETQQFMNKFRIGRIAEAWVDFVPPIQGGRFRARDGEAVEAPRVEVDSSSDERSAEPSPVFDGVERGHVGLRRRKGSSGALSDSSATSLESMELEQSAAEAKNDAPATKPELDDAQRAELEKFPNLDTHTQANIIHKYRELDQRIRDAGMYDCNYSAYAYEIARYTTLALLSYYCLQTGYYKLSATFLGLLWHQLVFTVHDAGHLGITHDYHTDSCIGILIADFLGGLSVCWWKRNHNVHHIVTNSAEHDPDIQHLPFFAISPRFFEGLRSTYYDRVMSYDAFAKFTLRYQHWLYYPILTFGRFNLYVLSWQYILLGQGPRKGPAWWHRYLEVAGQVFFWFWFGYLTLYKSLPTNWDRFVFVMISHAVTMPVHAQITLSHFAMSTADFGVAESFPQRMLRTTMDIDCPAWLDFFHGGLQFQAVHHLFPRIPRHNLRKTQPFVRQFCEEVGIPYEVYGFVEGNEKVIDHLGDIAKQARILAECQRKVAAKDLLEGH